MADTTYTGQELKVRIIGRVKFAQEILGTLSGGAVDQIFYTQAFPITKAPGVVGSALQPGKTLGAVVADGETNLTFETDLTSAVNNYYTTMTIRFLTGALAGEMRIITNYVGATKVITVGAIFGGVPNDGDTFQIEASIDLYDEGVEWLEDGTDYYVSDGDLGEITVLAVENPGPSAGNEVTCSYYSSLAVGYAQNIRLRTDRGLVEVYELGDQSPLEIKEMTIHSDGEIERYFIDRNLMRVLGVLLGTGSPLPYVNIEVAPGGFTAGLPLIIYENAKIGSTDFDAAIDAIVNNRSSFKALATIVTVVPA